VRTLKEKFDLNCTIQRYRKGHRLYIRSGSMERFSSPNPRFWTALLLWWVCVFLVAFESCLFYMYLYKYILFFIKKK